jgi:hypothetical protein
MPKRLETSLQQAGRQLMQDVATKLERQIYQLGGEVLVNLRGLPEYHQAVDALMAYEEAVARKLGSGGNE